MWFAKKVLKMVTCLFFDYAHVTFTPIKSHCKHKKISATH